MSAARAAISNYRNELPDGEQLVIRNGWIGSEHKVRVVESTRVGEHPAIVPELTATAYITGMHQIIVEDGDPYATGFLL